MKLKAIKKYPDFKIMLIYRSGEKRLLDGRKLHGLSDFFDELKDENYFRKAKIDSVFHATIEWPNGQDMAPEWLYRESVAI